MSRFDITFWKVILVGGGVIIIVAELCLLIWGTGSDIDGLFPPWARALGLVAGFGLILAVLAVRRKE